MSAAISHRVTAGSTLSSMTAFSTAAISRSARSFSITASVWSVCTRGLFKTGPTRPPTVSPSSRTPLPSALDFGPGSPVLARLVPRPTKDPCGGGSSGLGGVPYAVDLGRSGLVTGLATEAPAAPGEAIRPGEQVEGGGVCPPGRAPRGLHDADAPRVSASPRCPSSSRRPSDAADPTPWHATPRGLAASRALGAAMGPSKGSGQLPRCAGAPLIDAWLRRWLGA